MSMSLYHIDRAILELVDMDTGEIMDYEAFEELQMEREAKLENVACWIKNLVAEGAALRVEEVSLAERRKTIERKIERLKKYLSEALDGEKFETAKCAVSFRKTTSVSIGDLFYPWAEANAPELLRITQKVEPDKAAIKEALKNGMEMVDAELTEGVSLSVK